MIAIKRKEHAALNTKIVDGKYFLKGHLIFLSPLLCLSPHPLTESSIVEDDKATVRESVASRKKLFLAAALLQRQYDIMTSLAATLQPVKRSEGRLQQPISSQRADTKRIKGELPSKKSSFDAPRARLPDLSHRSRVSEFVTGGVAGEPQPVVLRAGVSATPGN